MAARTDSARWVAVRLPDGNWGKLTVVPSDRFKPWAPVPGWLAIAAYALHRLACRTWWLLRPPRRWEVRVHRYPDPDARPAERWAQESQPLFRSVCASRAAAQAEAHRVVEDLRSGRPVW